MREQQSCAGNFPPPHPRLGYFSPILLHRTNYNRTALDLKTYLIFSKNGISAEAETGIPTPTSEQPKQTRSS